MSDSRYLFLAFSIFYSPSNFYICRLCNNLVMLLSGSKKYSLSNIPHLQHSCHRSLSPHCGFEVQPCACACIRFTLQISQELAESKGHGDKEGIHCKVCCGFRLPDNVSDIRSVLLVRLHTGYEWWVHHWKPVDCEYKCQRKLPFHVKQKTVRLYWMLNCVS